MPLQLTCTSEQKIRITAAPLTVGGVSAAIQGALVVTSVDPAASVESDPSPLSATLVPNPVSGTTIFTVSANATIDPTAPPVIVSDTVAITVTPAPAAALGLTAGAPIPK
jgi:hypothetical protein